MFTFLFLSVVPRVTVLPPPSLALSISSDSIDPLLTDVALSEAPESQSTALPSLIALRCQTPL